MRLKGLRDIRTHGILAREGRLMSVARNLHGLSGTEENTTHSSDWNVKQHICKKKKVANTAIGISFHRELYPHTQRATAARPWMNGHFSRKARNSQSHTRKGVGGYLERKVKLHQIEIIKDLLAEFEQAIIEGLPVALNELARLKTRLAELLQAE